MPGTRRHFIGLLAAGIALPSAEISAAPNRTLTRAIFGPLVGSAFRSSHEGAAITLTLLAAESTGRRLTSPVIESSLLRFRTGPNDLPEGTYTLSHPAGEFTLHLVPGRPGRSLAYFCRVSASYLESADIPQRAA